MILFINSSADFFVLSSDAEIRNITRIKIDIVFNEISQSVSIQAYLDKIGISPLQRKSLRISTPSFSMSYILDRFNATFATVYLVGS